MDELNSGPIISVFGSSRPLPGSEAYADARFLGGLLATAGFTIATGGYEGTMAAVSEGAAAAGGRVIGVTSERIEKNRGVRPNKWLSHEIKYKTLAERQLHLVRHNQGIIVLPGGIGTLAEFALAWSFVQVNEISPRPIVLLGRNWRKTLDCYVQEEYVQTSHLALLKFTDTPAEALAYISQVISFH